MMKFPPSKFGILLGCGLCAVIWPAQAGDIPDGYPVTRYASLWQHSPFTTVSVQQEAAPAGFADKLVLVGVATIGNEKMATLINKDSQERIEVAASPNAQGLRLVSVEPNADPLAVTVTIQKGDETGKVKFDKATLPAAAPSINNPVPPQIPQPFTQNMNPAGAPPIPSQRVVRRTLPIPAPYQASPAAR